jgi:hypothetical protein
MGEAYKHLGDSELGGLLRAIFDRQGGCCSYTKAQLVLGDNASLDHIQAQSRGGIGTAANLQWVTKQVNACKHVLNHDEFVALCREVVKHA